MVPRLPQAFAGIVTVSVGHCHPKVLKAIQDQENRLQHTTTIYLHNEIAQYAKELTDRIPGNLKVGGFHMSKISINVQAISNGVTVDRPYSDAQVELLTVPLTSPACELHIAHQPLGGSGCALRTASA